MAALTLTVPQPGTGNVVTPLTPTATDTISLAVLGDAGCNLRIQSTGTGSTITISDAGFSPAGNAPPVTSITQSATQIRTVYVSPKRADLSTGLVTITASGALTGITYELYPA